MTMEEGTLRAQQIPLVLQIGPFPTKRYVVHISPTPAYVRGMDILEGLTPNTEAEKFRLQCRVVKAVT